MHHSPSLPQKTFATPPRNNVPLSENTSNIKAAAEAKAGTILPRGPETSSLPPRPAQKKDFQPTHLGVTTALDPSIYRAARCV